MRTIQFKIIIVMLSLGLAAHAQIYDHKYSEEFNTKDNVVIALDTRHTDVEIETWNKNKVLIEATIEITGASSKERADEIIQNWKFKALGNTSEIQITSKTRSLYGKEIVSSNGDDIIHINDFDFDFPEVSVGNLAVLDSLHIVLPDELYFPELLIVPKLGDLNFSFDSLSFDYEKYKNDENYLKEWQEQMKKSLEKMNVELKESPLKIKENSAQLKEELKAAQEERKKVLLEYAQRRKEAAKLREVKEQKRKEFIIIRNKEQENREKELAKKRVEIKHILADRDKIKIKRIIKIKAPKGAKYNMNVSYGSVSYPN